ncbi:hypothetical protein PTTG_10183 [Puccinia triticina 1-1 BBBD Race 1]|uniref:Uncharacterized protein n=1 Tax=Puccinia triticina (isolate 1-1 / race 1 (BBBD)) TaxID=630390 RepID=A0A180G1L5_PUCT1|nr:hypothetical protein PTTG_10183 [Puccinia triticina 1-1 BBBD Race 1]
MKEPNWNPAMEAQAVDCLYCLGQTSKFYFYQHYVQGTLEMNLNQVKNRKGELTLLSVPSHGNDDYQFAQFLMSNMLN